MWAWVVWPLGDFVVLCFKSCYWGFWVYLWVCGFYVLWVWVIGSLLGFGELGCLRFCASCGFWRFRGGFGSFCFRDAFGLGAVVGFYVALGCLHFR